MKSCSVDGCTNKYLCKGYCNLHYIRFKKYGDPLVNNSPTGKSGDPCSQCRINIRREDHSWCQPCLNVLSRQRNASERGPRYRRYKLTRTDIHSIKASQGNACVICQDNFDDVEDHVDHNNLCCSKEKTRQSGTCGECVRDLLCGSCNQGLGNFKDDPQRLANAIKYLAKWGIE